MITATNAQERTAGGRFSFSRVRGWREMINHLTRTFKLNCTSDLWSGERRRTAGELAAGEQEGRRDTNYI